MQWMLCIIHWVFWSLLVSFGTFKVILQQIIQKWWVFGVAKTSAMGTQFHGTLVRPCMRFDIPGWSGRDLLDKITYMDSICL